MGSNDPAGRDDIALSSSELDDVLNSAEVRSESGNDDESGLEKYGIWIKVEPETLEARTGGGDDLALDELASGAPPDSELTAEEEELLGELEAEVEEPQPEQGAGPAGEAVDFEGLEKDLQKLDSSGAEEEDLTVADLDMDLDELAPEPGGEAVEVEVPLSDRIPELDGVAEDVEAKPTGARSSDALLKKIEEDLKQIKREIQTLKKELSGIGRGGGEVEVPNAQGQPGFFAEEEDDSIALTGDELDNILNTADITEEKGGAPGPAEDLSALGPQEPAEEAEELDLLEPQEPVAGAQDLDLLEPGSLSAEPEEIQIELEEKPSAAGSEPELLAEELPEAGEQPADDSLVLEELAEVPEAEELTMEEPLPAAEAEELTLDDFSGESMEALEPEESLEPVDELESLAEPTAEAGPVEEPAAELDLGEELPDLSLADDQELTLTPAAGEPTPSEPEPAELELVEEPGSLVFDEAEPAAEPRKPGSPPAGASGTLPEDMREDVKSVLSYLDQLLDALPQEKVEEFAHSQHWTVYKKLFEDLGLGS